MKKKQLKLGAFMRPISIHTGVWRYPGAFPDANFNLSHIKRLIRKLEHGKFDAFFMADHLAVLNMPVNALKRSHTVTSFEPFTLLSALASATERIGLVATASTTFDEPYHVARRFASLDHLSGGRAGWNIVTTSNARDGIAVRWVLSQGSNKANELLASGSVDLASTAGAAALLARSNGVPLKVVYVYAKPAWAGVVVGASSPITSVAGLRGKKIAATRGTDPFFFLLRSLREAGLGQSDVELVHLQHADGRIALQRGDVDAWAGLDPFMADAELREKARVIYHNADLNTFGTLNAREEFLAKHPRLVERAIDSIAKSMISVSGT